jgi:hypothetical protein
MLRSNFSTVEMEYMDVFLKLARRITQAHILGKVMARLDGWLLKNKRLEALASTVFIVAKK